MRLYNDYSWQQPTKYIVAVWPKSYTSAYSRLTNIYLFKISSSPAKHPSLNSMQSMQIHLLCCSKCCTLPFFTFSYFCIIKEPYRIINIDYFNIKVFQHSLHILINEELKHLWKNLNAATLLSILVMKQLFTVGTHSFRMNFAPWNRTVAELD